MESYHLSKSYKIYSVKSHVDGIVVWFNFSNNQDQHIGISKSSLFVFTICNLTNDDCGVADNPSVVWHKITCSSWNELYWVGEDLTPNLKFLDFGCRVSTPWKLSWKLLDNIQCILKCWNNFWDTVNAEVIVNILDIINDAIACCDTSFQSGWVLMK